MKSISQDNLDRLLFGFLESRERKLYLCILTIELSCYWDRVILCLIMLSVLNHRSTIARRFFPSGLSSIWDDVAAKLAGFSSADCFFP